MKFPGRSQREDDNYGGAWGAQLEAPDASRHGIVDDGLTAFPERIVEAERQWFHARAEDFEHVDGRLYRDRASGLEYTHVRGCPLLAIGSPASEGVSVFFVAGGKLVFLRRADLPTVRTVHHGPIVAEQLPSYAPPTANVY